MASMSNVRQCGICKRWFEFTNPRVVCAVSHPEGTCCHYGDKEVPAPPVPESRPLLTEADGEECSRLFADWAQREGILARITEDQCRDMAKAFMMGFAHGVGTGAARTVR